MNDYILLVEDDEGIRSSVTELLEMEGFNVHACDNGQLALDYLQTTHELPKIILLDLMMPVMNGFEFCESISTQEKLLRIPVVVMSADGHIMEKQFQTNAVAYFKKPIDIDQMLATLKEVMDH